MLKKNILVIALLCWVLVVSQLRADICQTDVFVSGKEYPMFRIPSIVTTNKGTLLALAEGRDNISDHAQNDIVLKRSTDCGKTWGQLVVVAESGKNCLNNPQAVVLPDSGRVILLYQYNPKGYHARAIGDKIKALQPGVSGDDVGLCFLTYSDDDGQSWSKPKDITAGVKRAKKVIGFAGGPGIGIVLKNERYKGRVIMPFNQSWYEPDGERPFYVYAAYSDDNGNSWKYGNAAPYDYNRPEGKGYGDEVQMVELTDGRIMLNARSNKGNKFRKVAYSKDGGINWSPLYDDAQLPEPQCMGSIVRYSLPEDGQKNQILFSCPANQSGRPGTRKSRTLGTVYLSFDDGKTWPISRLLYKDMFGYSCLTVLADKTIGCLYEKDGNKTITFARFNLDWLCDDVSEGKK